MALYVILANKLKTLKNYLTDLGNTSPSPMTGPTVLFGILPSNAPFKSVYLKCHERRELLKSCQEQINLYESE